MATSPHAPCIIRGLTSSPDFCGSNGPLSFGHVLANFPCVSDSYVRFGAVTQHRLVTRPSTHLYPVPYCVRGHWQGTQRAR